MSIALVLKAAAVAAAAAARATSCQVLQGLQVLRVLLVVKESRAKTEGSGCQVSSGLRGLTGRMVCQVRQVHWDLQVRGTALSWRTSTLCH